MSLATHHTGMHISTPGNWVALELDALGDDDRIDALLDDRVAELPSLTPHRAALADVLTRSGSAARDAGVAFAAVMIDVDGDETPLLASLTVAVVERWPAAPSLQPGAGTVQLPAGTAARFDGVAPTTIVERGPELLVLTTQYVLAIPRANALAVLTFTSPNVLERDALCALFERIAETLELGDEPHDRLTGGGS